MKSAFHAIRKFKSKRNTYFFIPYCVVVQQFLITFCNHLLYLSPTK